MATITNTSMTGLGSRSIIPTTLTSSDTFTYLPRKNQTLIIENNSGVAVTVNIDGDGAGDLGVQGVGVIDISTGYDTAPIPDGEAVAIPLDSISRYLAGTIAVTGGTGATAYLISY